MIATNINANANTNANTNTTTFIIGKEQELQWWGKIEDAIGLMRLGLIKPDTPMINVLALLGYKIKSRWISGGIWDGGHFIPVMEEDGHFFYILEDVKDLFSVLPMKEDWCAIQWREEKNLVLVREDLGAMYVVVPRAFLYAHGHDGTTSGRYDYFPFIVAKAPYTPVMGYDLNEGLHGLGAGFSPEGPFRFKDPYFLEIPVHNEYGDSLLVRSDGYLARRIYDDFYEPAKTPYEEGKRIYFEGAWHEEGWSYFKGVGTPKNAE